MSRQEKARQKRAARRRQFPEATVANSDLLGFQDGRWHQRWLGVDGTLDGSQRRVTYPAAATQPVNERPKAERGPFPEPSIRDEIAAAGSGARALYESKVAALTQGEVFGPSAGTKRKWLRLVERLEAA